MGHACDRARGRAHEGKGKMRGRIVTVSDAKVFGKTGKTVEGLDCCNIWFGDRYLVTYSKEGILISWE